MSAQQQQPPASAGVVIRNLFRVCTDISPSIFVVKSEDSAVNESLASHTNQFTPPVCFMCVSLPLQDHPFGATLGTKLTVDFCVLQCDAMFSYIGGDDPMDIVHCCF